MLTKLTKNIIIVSIFLLAFSGLSQEYNNFEIRYQDNIKGDLTFISNQILNRDGGTSTTEPDDPYNNLNNNNNYWPASNRDFETGGRYNYNDYKQMHYINVDPGDGRFSSSSANLSFPNPDCNRIRYAGLYWSATYPRDNTMDPVGTPRQYPINQIKFKVPGGNYVDITANEILYDGLTNPSLQSNAPYAAYADVTDLIIGLTNPTGDYTVANIPAAQGQGYDINTGTSYMSGGSAGGWTLVIVYENPNLRGKLITTFDGFARVTGTDQVDIDYNGFTTIPVGQVNANIGAATLEGDFRLTGDRMRIRASSNTGFTTMSNGSNPANNFFNSNITLNGSDLPGRTPSSLNTLGYDTDIFTLGNYNNSVIPNNETAATFRFETNGDQYYPFFNSFNVEIIEPEIILEKKVEDIAGNDITGMGVNLGQTLDYVLSFRNLGNDDGTNYTIRDVLPVNVTLDQSNFVLPQGVTYSFDATTRTVIFSIPDNLIESGHPVSSIRMRVNVAENCFDFVDACTELIQNLAYATYEGVINNNQITDDPSVTDFNTCGFVVPGSTNFLLDDLDNCNFTRTVLLCGDDVLLNAGDNFDSYVWVRDINENGEIDASDPVLQNGPSDTLLVTEEGTYIVDKIIPDPCKGFKETMVVERFGSNATNPIIDYMNTVNGDSDVANDIQGEIVTCGIDGDLLPRIFLCGTNDTQILQTNITDAQTISWELLDESSCTAAPTDCANKNLACSWNQVATGSSYSANTAGKYRLVVEYQNGCSNRFYFDVFQNNLTIQYNTRDIICTTDGYINITNIGSSYGFQLIDITNNSILIPFSANNGPNFNISSNGQYRVEVVQLDGSGYPFPNACVFSTPDIGIRDRNFQVDINTTPANCNAQGSIQVDILNVEPDYTYILRQSDGTLIDDETAQPDNTHTFNVNEGDYIIEVTTDDGCFFSQNVEINRIDDPALSGLTTRDIGCSAGTIDLNATGGFPNPDYGYAIWSKDGVELYTSVSAIPGNAYQVEDEFTFGWEDDDFDPDTPDVYIPGEDGTYVFVVVDANGCYAFSNAVTINDNGPLNVTPTNSEIICSGTSSADLTIGTSGGVAPFRYSIDDGATFQDTNTFVGLPAGSYNLVVEDSSGCSFTDIYSISEPFTLSASAVVAEVVECNPTDGAEVQILNVQGGTAPYEYSFDGSANFSTSNIAFLPHGTHNLSVRDDLGCTFVMAITVPEPVVPPNFEAQVVYECDGEAQITINTSNTTDFDYEYELNSVRNTPADSNVFNNVPVGNQTVTVHYTTNTPPTPSDLLLEDFGVGNNTSISEIDPAYCYEPQDGSIHACDPGVPTRINDGEYSVTQVITQPFGSWLSPNDHTGNTNGRFLAINVGGVAGVNGVIYAKPNIEVLPNQDITISLEAFNLLRNGSSGGDPTLEIQLVNGGTVIATTTTGNVPKNNNADDWHNYIVTLNPGAATNLDIVIRTNSAVTNGNDIAIDDIRAYQIPLICASSVDIPVVVEAGRAFGASIINSNDVSCFGLSDGTITFEVDNFDTTAGFEYSLDGGATFTTSLVSPVTTSPMFDAGNHTLLIRKADDINCTASVTQNIDQPSEVIADATITTNLNCVNGGATITASASGGTPTYSYQLENNGGSVLSGFDFASNGSNTVFSGLPEGQYIVRVRDSNSCEDIIDSSLVVLPTNPVDFDLVGTTCYSGNNDATVEVTVANGNGNYIFSINGGPWLAPTPSNATNYTFTNLSEGSYDINVRDGYGCLGTSQNIVIEEAITVSATAPTISACESSTFITISTTGGDGSFQFAVMPDGQTPNTPDFNASTVREVFAPGDYDVYLRDPSGGPAGCTALTEITIFQDAPISVTASPTNVECHGESNGAISISVDSGGQAPFRFSIDDGVSYQISSDFPNLSAGNYLVKVIDANDCETTSINTIVDQPDEIVAEARITQPYTCLQLGEISIGSITPTSGGSGNYQYSINGGAWTASTTGSHVFNDLSEGTYSIHVRDANQISCDITLSDIVIPVLPTAPTLSETIDYNCDGTGRVTISPFDASYTYILDGVLPGQSGTDANIFNNVASGNHTITVDYGSGCTEDISLSVLSGYAFEASIIAFENLDCHSNASGSISITAENYGANGFEYSVNGGVFNGPFSVDQQISGLAAQTHTIEVRDVDNPTSCSITLTQTLGEPTVLIANANITEAYTCDNTGATITASASGGVQAYEYQLENNSGTIINPYQSSPIFGNLLADDYIVRVRDTNGCTDPIDSAITIVAPVNPTFVGTATSCYDGSNNAEILVTVTSVPGNGGFQFQMNSGPWITPTPANATSYTFSGLSQGTYQINVRDGFGCQATPQTITINPQLTAVVNVVDVTCNDGSISINANGGDGNFVYAFVAGGTTVTPSDFSASNSISISSGNEGTFDVYVRDNGGSDYCEYTETVTVDPSTPIVFTASGNDPECHDGFGSIDVNITSGDIPYQIRIVDLDNGGSSNQTVMNISTTTHSFYNLQTGEYEVYVQDTNGCETQLSPNITINNPEELTASIVPILPSACGSVDPLDYGFQFTGYPSSYPAGTVIEFSADGGATWTGNNSVPGTSDRLMGYFSGTSVFPSLRTVIGGVEICRTNLPRFIIPYPLDDLDISISTVVVGCNELQVTVQGTAGVPDYEYTYTDDPSTFNIASTTWTTPVPGAHTWTGLIPGRTYVFYVRDSTGCIRQSNVNVNDITTNPLEISSSYEPSCSGANDGEITYTLTDTDGTSHPNMRWEFYNANTNALVQTNAGHPAPIPAAASITVSGLASGEYYIVVTEVTSGMTDACVSGSENLLLEELDAITATLNKLRDISCNTSGLIAIDDIRGGSGNFTYIITGPTGFSTITGTTENPVDIPANSPAGNYSVRITDQFGCYEDFGPIAMDLTPNPTIDSIVVNNCAIPNSMTINATSSASEILYSIDGGATYVDNGGVFNNLAAGTYAISILDGNGCSATSSAEVYPVLEASASLTKLLDCTTTPDAEISIEVQFGSSNYDYEITNGLGSVVARTALPSNPFVFSTGIAEDYVITIYDTNTNTPECSRSFNVTVPPVIIPSFTETHVDANCNGNADGSISLAETNNGVNPLTYIISPSAGSFNAATRTFENLPAGTYSVTGTGSNGCSFSINGIQIDEPLPITVATPTVIEFGCTSGNNTNNASISIDPGTTGGSGNYVRYDFLDTQGTPATTDDVIVQSGASNTYIETDLDGGDYIVNVYDDTGCLGSASAIIRPFVSLSNPTVAITQQITCNPGNDAQISVSIDLTPPSGSATLTYDVIGIDNAYSVLNQSSSVFASLGIGNYEVTVQNTDTGCSVQTTFEIEDTNTFEISTDVQNVLCFGEDGSVEFSISDPVNSYSNGFTWQIYDSQGTMTLSDDVIISGANGTSGDLGPTAPYSLPAGQYRVEITQTSDPSCSANEMFVISGPSEALTATAQITDITCDNDGVIEITNARGGWGDISYFVDLASNPAPSNTASFQVNPLFTGLTGGVTPGTDYQIWVADSSGCMLQLPNENLTDPLPITADLQLSQPNCLAFEGAIDVINVRGGQGNNYSYLLQRFDGTAFVDFRPTQANAYFGNLSAGEYRVVVSDQWGCSGISTNTIDIADPLQFNASLTTLLDCEIAPANNAEISIDVVSGSGNYEYEVTGPIGQSRTALPTNPFVWSAASLPGTYRITVYDLSGSIPSCNSFTDVVVEPAIEPVLSIESFNDVNCFGANDGTITVSASNSGIGPYTFEIISGPGSTSTFPIAPTSFTNSTAVFQDLEGLSNTGITYTVRAIAANSCSADITQVILQPEAISNISLNVVQYSCSNGNNTDFASITVDETALTGGSNTYVRFEFINNTTSTTVQDGANNRYTETDFAGGNYTINVYDDRGCIGSASENISPFVRIANPVVNTLVDITCTPGNDSEIQVSVATTPSSATPNLEYTVSGTDVSYSQTNSTGAFTAMGVGNYIVQVTNLDTGCTVSGTHEIASPDAIEVIATKLTDEECLNDGVSNGSFRVDINNYVGAYTYQVYDINNNPVAGQSGAGNTNTTLTLTNLSGGGYYIRITETNAPFCEKDSNAFTIVTPSTPITIGINEEASVSCSNDQGVLLIDPQGGFGPYTITLTNTTTSQTYTENNVESFLFTGLSAGSFDISVLDSMGCAEYGNVILIRPDDYSPTISTTPLSCFNGNTGTVYTTVPSGRNVDATAIYQYQLNTYEADGVSLLNTSTPQSGTVFNNISAGFYSITTSDNYGCSFTTPIEEITNPEQVSALLIRTSPLTCATGVELNLSATGGLSGSYEYSTDNMTWITMSGNSVNLPLSGTLPSGIYQYYVRDAMHGCAAVLSNEIQENPIEPLELIVDASAAFVNCNGDSTAAIYATADGGLGNYMFELFTDPSLSAGSRVAGPQSNGNFNMLHADTYYVSVVSGDCPPVSEEVIITEPSLLTNTEVVQDVSCSGYDNGSITVTLSGGAGGYEYAISPNLDLFDSNNVFDSLAAGDYTIIAQDQNGCFLELHYTIDEPENLSVSGVATPEVCVGEENGIIELTITGGTQPYSTRLSDESDFVLGRDTLTDLAAGGYIVFVRDANGCQTDIGITVDSGVDLSGVVNPVYECSGTTPENYVNITLNDSSVIGDVLYAIDSTDPNDMQLNPDFRNSAPGEHYIAIAHVNGGCVRRIYFEIEDFKPLTLTVEQLNLNEITATAGGGLEDYTFYFDDFDNGSDKTYRINQSGTYLVRVVDQNGCEAVSSIEMEFIDIEIPEFFTPDGDGQNDFWMPRNQEAFPEILTIIFDRYGREVYRLELNDPGWNGLYKESELPTGDYWYVIKLQGENDEREFVGHFTLYR